MTELAAGNDERISRIRLAVLTQIRSVTDGRWTDGIAMSVSRAYIMNE